MKKTFYSNAVFALLVLIFLISFSGFGQSVGDFHQGGYVFLLDELSERGGGIVAAPSNSGTAPLACANLRTNTGSGQGPLNTREIIRECGGKRNAAKLCDELHSGGYSDWYLPTRDELYFMLINLNDKIPSPGISAEYATSSIDGGFINTVSYRSRSNVSWASQDTDGNIIMFPVRCVRRF